MMGHPIAIAISVAIICLLQWSPNECAMMVTPEHALLERYLAITCHRERITVQLDFNRRKHITMSKAISEMIWRGRICIGSNKSGECCSQLNMIQEYHIVSVGYRKCDIEKTFFAGGFNFVAKVHYWGVSNVNEQFKAECAVPFMESHVKAKMVGSRRPIRLASVDFVNDQPSSPLSVRLGSNLHVAIESTIEGMQERLHTYPIACWINAENGVTVGDHQYFAQRYFIENGCPIIENNSQLAFLEQKTGSDSFAEWTKIKIPITQALVNSSLLNGSVVDDDATYGRISVHCDVIICTGQKLVGFQNTPMCPQATFCSPTGGRHRGLPTWISPFVQQTLSVSISEPVRIILANATHPLDSEVFLSDEIDVESETSSTKGPPYDGMCANYCTTAVEKAMRRREECMVEGIPVYLVIIIAIISFGFGIAFVAILWIIHIKTDPLRKIRCMERNGHGIGLDAIYRDPIIRPMANAFMGPIRNERRQLLVLPNDYS